jgi:hypothetical protein
MGMEMEKKEEEFEETKRVIRTVNRRTDNTMANKKDKGTNNDLQNIHIKLKNE